MLLATTAPGSLVENAADWTASLVHLAVDWGGRIIGVALVMMAAWIVAGWARRSVRLMIERGHVDQTLASFVGNIVRWSILILGLVACLSIFGINIAAVTAVIGAAGLAIGLAMQGSLTNLAAGIMLLVLRPFRIGDAVTVAGQAGSVHDIDLFNTKIDTADNRRLIIPNSAVFGGTIENATHHRRRRIDLTVRTVFGADVAATRAALFAAANAVPQRLAEEGADVALTDIGPNGMVWAVRVWTATGEVGAGRDALIAGIKRALDEAQVAIPVAGAPN